MDNYGNETIVRLANGRTLRCDTYEDNPEGASYLRVCEADGTEIAYWNYEEWEYEPQLVVGAIMGLCNSELVRCSHNGCNFTGTETVVEEHARHP